MASETNRTLRRGFDRLRHGWSCFWLRVSEGVELQALWGQFRSDARDTYGQYSREVDWETVDSKPRWQRPLDVIRHLFWILLGKLSPARRVFLLIVLVLVGLAVLDVGLFGWPQALQFLVAIAGLLVLLALELADRVSMKRDLEIAKEVQSWLLPDAPPVAEGFEIAFATRPANTVAGDYYDAIWREAETGGHRSLLLVEADVAGKGMPAALLAATFRASLHTLAALPSSLAQLARRLNTYTCTHSLDGRRFTTAFLGELEPTTRRLTYVCAGHSPAILIRAAGSSERLAAGGMPFGVDPGSHYETATTPIAPGDLLILFTDGACDAVNEQGQEFGEDRLLEMVSRLSGLSATEALSRLNAGVDDFVGDARQLDDITWLVMRAIREDRQS